MDRGRDYFAPVPRSDFPSASFFFLLTHSPCTIPLGVWHLVSLRGHVCLMKPFLLNLAPYH